MKSTKGLEELLVNIKEVGLEAAQESDTWEEHKAEFAALLDIYEAKNVPQKGAAK